MRFPTMKTIYGTVDVIGYAKGGGYCVSLPASEIKKGPVPICLLSIDKLIPPNYRGGPCVCFIHHPNGQEVMT